MTLTIGVCLAPSNLPHQHLVCHYMKPTPTDEGVRRTVHEAETFRSGSDVSQWSFRRRGSRMELDTMQLRVERGVRGIDVR